MTSSVTNLQHLITSSSDRLIIAADNNNVSAGSKIEFYVDGIKYSEVTPTGLTVDGDITVNDTTPSLTLKRHWRHRSKICSVSQRGNFLLNF